MRGSGWRFHMPGWHPLGDEVAYRFGGHGHAPPDADGGQVTALQQAAHGAGGDAAELAGGFLDGPQQGRAHDEPLAAVDAVS